MNLDEICGKLAKIDEKHGAGTAERLLAAWDERLRRAEAFLGRKLTPEEVSADVRFIGSRIKQRNAMRDGLN